MLSIKKSMNNNSFFNRNLLLKSIKKRKKIIMATYLSIARTTKMMKT